MKQMIVTGIIPAETAIYRIFADCLRQITSGTTNQDRRNTLPKMEESGNDKKINRREFLKTGLRVTLLLGIGGATVLIARKTITGQTVWQLDPAKCIQCGRCATNCVLSPSAVKCTHVFAMCGYCDLCSGISSPEPKPLRRGLKTIFVRPMPSSGNLLKIRFLNIP